MRGSKAIRDALAAHRGGMSSFVKQLDRGAAPYLSYSKITSVEFCPYRYYLEYVKRIRLRPEPVYFTKGRTFHKAADRLYRAVARGATVREDALERLICKHDDETDRQHLRNAVALLRENAMADWEVLGVEQPFVLSLTPDLPPCIGVVDLILRREDVLAVIDHKTGKRLGNGDAMQLALYREHALRIHRIPECLTFFDEYRWVNDLRRIRKPAFQRTRIRLRPTSWNGAIRRFRRGYRKIRKIEAENDAPGTGSCYMCPFRAVCGKATYQTASWW